MSKPKILFVDDEPRIVRLLSMLFRQDYEVLTATSGLQALELVKQHVPHVVISDQRMPKMTGIELLSAVRHASPATSRILLTGYSDLVAIIRAVNDGEVYRFLNKPWKEDELIATVRDAAAVAERAFAFDRQVGYEDDSTLSSATKLLAIDGVGTERLELVEMFTADCHVISAHSLPAAMRALREHEIGVIVAVFDNTSEEAISLCAAVRENYPHTTIVLLANSTDSELIVRLINEGNIYRFAMRPITPNMFRLAVGAALKEHQRRIAPNRLRAEAERAAAADDAKLVVDASLATEIRSSLERFTKTW